MKLENRFQMKLLTIKFVDDIQHLYITFRKIWDYSWKEHQLSPDSLFSPLHFVSTVIVWSFPPVSHCLLHVRHLSLFLCGFGLPCLFCTICSIVGVSFIHLLLIFYYLCLLVVVFWLVGFSASGICFHLFWFLFFY